MVKFLQYITKAVVACGWMHLHVAACTKKACAHKEIADVPGSKPAGGKMCFRTKVVEASAVQDQKKNGMQ